MSLPDSGEDFFKGMGGKATIVQLHKKKEMDAQAREGSRTTLGKKSRPLRAFLKKDTQGARQKIWRETQPFHGRGEALGTKIGPTSIHAPSRRKLSIHPIAKFNREVSGLPPGGSCLA